MYANRAKEIFDNEIRELEKLKNSIDSTFDQVIEVLYRCQGKVVMMGIGKNTTSKSMEAGSSAEGKYEDEAKHPSFFTLPVTAFPVFLSS